MCSIDLYCTRSIEFGSFVQMFGVILYRMDLKRSQLREISLNSNMMSFDLISGNQPRVYNCITTLYK